jgi:hypothetical protein
MTKITIQCQLFANDAAKQYLWQLMAERNTPLVNELLRLIAQHDDFLVWRSKGKLPTAEVTKLAKTLKTDPRFNNQPAKFFISAEKVACYTFKSWLAVQKRTQKQLEQKAFWLQMLRTDQELIADCDKTIEEIREKAQAILESQDQGNSTESERELRQWLYQAYKDTNESLTQSAIAYLLKHRCKIPTAVMEDEEDTKKFLKYRRKIAITVKRLTQQLENRLPQGRDLTGLRFLEVLESVGNQVPIDDLQASKWQAQLLKKPDLVPFPIVLESNMDLMWFLDPSGAIGLNIGGISEYDFAIGCGQRQLHYFQKFLSDYKTMIQSNRQHTSSLFLLRSAKLIWVPKDGQGDPWKIHDLYLACTLDTRLLTAEGTTIVKQEVSTGTVQKLQTMRDKTDRTKTQDNYIQRLQSTLDKLDKTFDRPNKALYQGQPNIVVAVTMGLETPVMATVFDLRTQSILACRNPKQLLGEDYRLLNRQRSLQSQQRHIRHKAQKKGASFQPSNVDLGEYLDRLFASKIVELARTYNASSIALPQLDQIRFVIQCELESIAEQKIPGYVEGQKRYIKQLRINLHNWSYNRLTELITNKAAQLEIAIEHGNQPARASPNVQAKEVALTAYAKRSVS